MKNLIFSTLLTVVAFTSNSQIVTVSGFGTFEQFGPINDTLTITDILLENQDGWHAPSDELPYGYKYVIDFDQQVCTLFNGDDEEIVAVMFYVIDKTSDRDFQIQFADATLDDLEDTYGIIVKDTVAAHFQFNTIASSVYLTMFDAMYIY
jgi:hypothetical protein